MANPDPWEDDTWQGCAICGLPSDGDDGTWLYTLGQWGLRIEISALTQLRDEGCLGCCLIFDAIQAVHPNNSPLIPLIRNIQMTIDRGDAGGLTVNVNFRLSDRTTLPTPTTHFELFGLWGSANPFKSLARVDEIIKDTRDVQACGAKISTWLGNCVGPDADTWHTSSCRGTDPDFTPRRLIHVRQASDPDVHLVEPGDPLERVARPVSYVALSYCWGPDTTGIVKTLTENIDQHRRGISISTLPKTLQDAIAVSRSINVRYIWIDALCIIQNDLNDWEAESAKMLDIYSNSRLTIAVHPAASCKDGFLGRQFFGQDTWQIKFQTSIPGNAAPTSPIPMALRLRRARDNGVLLPFPEDDASYETPLLKRGWTFQEAIMPRRIIHFTNRELIWECGSAHWCECGHAVLPPRRQEGGTAHPLLVKTNTETSRTGQILDDPGQVWINILRSYGERGFTNPSDRLIALSGVAKIMVRELIKVPPFQQETLASVYLAGIYRTHIPRQLLWVTDWKKIDMVPSVIKDKTDPYLAPSWSWASVRHLTTYIMGRGQETSHVELVGASCKPKRPGGDLTGMIASGELQICGLVVPVVLNTWPSPWLLPDGSALSGINKWTGRPTNLYHQDHVESVVRARNGCKVEVLCDVEQPVSVSDPDSQLCACWGSNWCWNCAEDIDWENPEFCCMKMATHLRSKAVHGAWERVALGTLHSRSVLPERSRRIPRNTSQQNLDEIKLDFEREEWELFGGGEIKTLRVV
ncbi:hypothetical protein RB599_004534 [Gaeumannomyces hyphopodioides]